MLNHTTQEENDEAFRAAVEKFATCENQQNYTVETNGNTNKGAHQVLDVRKLDMNDRGKFIDRVLKVPEEDNERFLTKLRSRFDE